MDNRSKIMRAAADTILEMAEADPAFVDRFLDDPVGTMEPLGISPGLANEAAAQYAELIGRGDVAGYKASICIFDPKTMCKLTILDKKSS